MRQLYATALRIGSKDREQGQGAKKEGALAQEARAKEQDSGSKD